MSKRLVLVAVLLACSPAVCSAETLFDAIRLAYEGNPALRAQRAELRAVDEGLVQARAGYGPQLSVTGQVAGQAARVQEPGSLFAPGGTTDYRAATGSTDLSLVQPLYTAGATRSQVRG